MVTILKSSVKSYCISGNASTDVACHKRAVLERMLLTIADHVMVRIGTYERMLLTIRFLVPVPVQVRNIPFNRVFFTHGFDVSITDLHENITDFCKIM